MDFLSVLVLLLLRVGAVSPEIIITAERGQNVSLTCDVPNLDGDRVLEWRRSDLKEEYVFRDTPFDPDLQHPSFRNRVFLQDGWMEDGERSVVLQDVMVEDSGTYECRVLQRGTSEPDSGPISTIELVVVPELEVIQAETGQSVTMPCRAPHIDPQVSIRWSRHDLEPQEVLLIEGGVVQGQHPSFRNRVEVGQRVEDGDLSVVLKSVMPEDSGTYQCRVVRRSASRRRRSSLHADPISSVYLSVSAAAADHRQNGGAEDGFHPALMAGMFTAGVVLGAAAAAAVLTVLIRRRSDGQNQNPLI